MSYQLKSLLVKVMSLASICQLILFVYEYLAWQLDLPDYTTHEHHRELFGRNKYFLFIQINSLPHLCAAYSFHQRIRWGMSIYIPYLILFTIGQIYTWWLPYLFEKGLWYADEQKFEEYNKYHLHHHRILPRFGDHLVIPDTEHTILFVLTCLTWVFTIRSFLLMSPRGNLKKKMK